MEGRKGCLREGERGRLERMFKVRHREWQIGKEV